MSARKISPAAVLGAVVFVVLAVAVAVVFDSPTSTWILFAFVLVAVGLATYGGRQGRR